MAYTELIKNFERVREYMRQFYLYGFKSREEYGIKSARSYDDDRRRIETWLGEYMGFKSGANGKNVFISIDSRAVKSNPLFKAWKTCSFTDKDITLHFIVLDILKNHPSGITTKDICDVIENDYMCCFVSSLSFDESTVRKKLKEYETQGIVTSRKDGKTVVYTICKDNTTVDADALAFFSESAPCGVIGSFIADTKPANNDNFAFKHHYITQTMDSEILAKLLCAIRDKRNVITINHSPRTDNTVSIKSVPLKIFISTQNGRQYVMVYHYDFGRIMSYRLDYINDVELLDECENFDHYRNMLCRMEKHMWGVNATRHEEQLYHVEFTVSFAENEGFIYKRMMREKRCGNVELVGKGLCRFSADVYNEQELVPWIRTFAGRIVKISFTDKELEASFKEDIRKMYQMYCEEGGDGNAV